MYLWNETEAKRGSCEIYTLLCKHLRDRCTGAKRLILYSDSCGGQSKNRSVDAMFLKVINDGIYEAIDHKFLCKGHTFLSCDRDFAVIERKKRKTTVIVPDDVIKMIQTSRVVKPFEVVKVKGSNILDFKSFSSVVVKKKLVHEDKKSLNFRNIIACVLIYIWQESANEL